MDPTTQDIQAIAQAMDDMEINSTRIKRTKRMQDDTRKAVTNIVTETKPASYEYRKETSDPDNHYDEYGRVWQWMEFDSKGDWFTKWYDDIYDQQSQYRWCSWTAWQKLQSNNQNQD